MPRVKTTLLLAAACVGATVIAVNAGASGSGTRVLDLTGTVITDHVTFDAAPKGMSPGDVGYVVGKVFRAGKPYGRYQGTCTQLPSSSSLCSFSLGLPDGQLLIQSAYGPGFNTGSVAREAVVGGTGAYAGARGQGIDRELTDTKLVFHLVLQPS